MVLNTNMIPSKKPSNFDQLVDRIASGEITRKQATEMSGLNIHTFNGWLKRSGALARLRDTRGNLGDNNVHSHAKNNPELGLVYKQAVEKALASPRTSLMSVWRGFPQTNYEILRQKVAAAKRSQPDKETIRVLEKALQERSLKNSV